MRKLNKLQINSEKFMNPEELVTIRGGYGSECCECHIVGDGVRYIQSTPSSCNSDCHTQWGGVGCVAVYYLIK